MNAAAVLRAPWVASARSSRWLALILIVALAMGEIPAMVLLDGRVRDLAVAATWGCAIGVWWLLVVGNALWLGRDAATLSLPHVRHIANASVPAYAALTALLPAAIFAFALGHALVWYVGFALAVTGCLLFLLLPSGIWLASIIAFVVVTNLHLGQLPSPNFNRLALYGIAPAIALIGLAAWRWFRVLDMPAPTGMGLTRPVIWNLRAQATLGFLGSAGGRTADALLARSAQPWLAPVPDIRHTGPAHPVRSIRIALGRNVMPQTPSSHVRLAAYSIAVMAVFLAPSYVSIMRTHGGVGHVLRALLLTGAGGAGLAMIFAFVFPLIGTMIYGWRLPQRWITGDAELALLRLLPRLGDAASVRRSTTLACLANGFYLGAIQWILVCASGWVAGAPIAGCILACLCAATTVALVAAPVLRMLGGRPLSGWLILVLTLLTAALDAAAAALTFRPGGIQLPHVVTALALALLVVLAVLAALGWRGQQALRLRPHPFLGIAP